MKIMRRMKSLLTQGAEANRSGEVGQQMFEGYLRGFKIKIVNDHPSYRQPRVEFAYRNANADYLYKDYERNFDVLWEVRSQIGGGTTDEKLISTIETLASCPYSHCGLVLFGDGFRGWVRQAAAQRAQELSGGNKDIRVINAVGDVLYRHLQHLIEQGQFLPRF